MHLDEAYTTTEAVVNKFGRRREVIDISWLEQDTYIFIKEEKQHKNQAVTHTFYEDFKIIEN